MAQPDPARALTTPTEHFPRVRRTDVPPVAPIPAARVAQARRDAPTRITPAAAETEAQAATSVLNKIIDQQHELNMGSFRRLGPGGVFGWRPTARPSLAEVAAARKLVAEREERRRHAHQRHLDRLEAARGWVTLLCLVGLLAIIVGAAVIAFGILAGWYAWAPTHVT